MPISKKQVDKTLLNAIHLDGASVAKRVSEALGISPQAVNRHLRQLTEQGLIEAHGNTKGRRYSLVQLVESSAYPIEGLQEDRVWTDFVRPRLEDLPSNVLKICLHGLTEMVNNAIDHSEGEAVLVSITRSPLTVKLQVLDDGVGIFRKITRELRLEDEKHAVLELSKGKLTTDPSRHSGEGIFFTSRMFDRFTIRSGALYLAHDTPDMDWLMEDSEYAEGTGVTMVIALDSDRTIQEVFDRFTTDEGGSYGFDVTHIPVGLAQIGEDNLISRSQAKRLLARVDLFRKVVLDFSGVSSIGQAFADEIFRVFAEQHPEIDISPIGASPEVRKMINRARSGSRPD